MSSSDKLPDWSLFRERSVPVETDLLSPAIETGAMLQAYHTLLEAEKQAAEEIRQQGIDALVQQALLVANFSITLDRYQQKLEEASLNKVYRSLSIVKDKMLDALQATGLKILIPHGKPFDEIASYVDVRGWRHHENFSDEIVAEVIEPIVFYQGKLVHSGVVFMGAPKEKEPGASL